MTVPSGQAPSTPGFLMRGDAASWLRALKHPLRPRILGCYLDVGTMMPSAVTEALGVSLGIVSYHIREMQKQGLLELVRETQHRGATGHHYRIANRGRVLAALWGLRATLLVTEAEQAQGADPYATVTLDSQAFDEFLALTAVFLTEVGELGERTRERIAEQPAHGAERDSGVALTSVAVLLATDKDPDVA